MPEKKPAPKNAMSITSYGGFQAFHDQHGKRRLLDPNSGARYVKKPGHVDFNEQMKEFCDAQDQAYREKYGREP